MDTVTLFSCKSTARIDSVVKSLSAFRKPGFAFVTPAEHLNLNGFRRVFESKQASDNLSTPSFNPSFSADFPQIPFWIQVKSEKKKRHSSEFFQPLSFGIAQWQFLLVVPCEKYQRKLERKSWSSLTSVLYPSFPHAILVLYISFLSGLINFAFHAYPQNRRTHVRIIVVFSFSITFYHNLMLFLPFYRQRHWDLPVL